MINFINIELLKRKFATCIAKIHSFANIPLDNIDDKIIHSSFFDCFEENDISRFLNMSSEDVCYELFKMRYIKEDVDIVDPVYWAGLQYMSIFLNFQLPLKTILLLCPLKEMVSHFEIYHEMNDIEIYKLFENKYFKKSILEKLRKEKGYSVRQLSDITGISQATLRYYETNNYNLFSASHEVILNLSSSLNTSLTFFSRYSGFIPFSKNLINDIGFKTIFFNNISKYYRITFETIPSISFDKCDEPYLLINNPTMLFVNGRQYYIDDFMLKNLFRVSIRQLVETTTAKQHIIFF